MGGTANDLTYRAHQHQSLYDCHLNLLRLDIVASPTKEIVLRQYWSCDRWQDTSETGAR
jgi:hypothetical protein